MLISKIFMRRLREARERRGWSQAELAKRVTALGHSLDKTAVTRIEGDNRKVTLDDAAALAATLDVPLLALLLPEGTEEVSLTRKLSLGEPLAHAWMSGRAPLSRESMEFYREAARNLPGGSLSPGEFNLLLATGRDRQRTKEVLHALIERERRDLEELERMTAARPKFAEALEDARKSLDYKERWFKEEEK
jgi:transcriptional regulator with XRE-family HTH domain